MPSVSVITLMMGESAQASSKLDGRLSVAEASDDFEVIAVTPVEGRAQGLNSGARRSTADYMCFTNTALELQGDSLRSLIQYAVTHPRVGAVGAKVVSSFDQTVLYTALAIGLDYLPIPLFRGFPSSHDAVNKSRRVNAVSSDCMLVRRGAFGEIGGFDAAVSEGYLDLDFCLRLGERAWEVHYNHEAVGFLNPSTARRSFRHVGTEEVGAFRSRWQTRVYPDEFQYYWEDGLMRFEQHMLYPLEIEIAPPLRVNDVPTDRGETADMLRTQSRRMLEMVKENIRMREWCRKMAGRA